MTKYQKIEYELSDYVLILLSFLYPFLNYLIEVYIVKNPIILSDPHPLQHAILSGFVLSIFFMTLRFSTLSARPLMNSIFLVYGIVGILLRVLFTTKLADFLLQYGMSVSIVSFSFLHFLIHFSRIILKAKMLKEAKV